MNLLRKVKLPLEHTDFLALLLSADSFYIGLHLVHKIARIFDWPTVMRGGVFSLVQDLGLAESFQYAKEFWIALLCAWLVLRKRQPAYLGWSLLFVYLLLDDMLTIHELLGNWLVGLLNLDPTANLISRFRIQDIGELAVSGIFGLLFFSLIAAAYYRGTQETRTNFRYLLGMLMVLVGFGVVLDVADRLLDIKILIDLAVMIEDGGEMLAMSFICWFAFVLARREDKKG